MISLSGTTSLVDRLCYSPSAKDSPTFTLPSSLQKELNTPPQEGSGVGQGPPSRVEVAPKTRSAGSTTERAGVHTAPAVSVMGARSAPKTDTPKIAAWIDPGIDVGLQPKYLRYNLWTTTGQCAPYCTADWSETATPLVRPPERELANPVVTQTLQDHSHFFAVHTPISVNVFEYLLADHPNQPFVTSVCRGLRKGFWPWANTLRDDLPEFHLQEPNGTYNEKQLEFFRKQLRHEQEKGRYLPSAGRTLLPGMYVSPICAVPKPGSTDLRLVNDHSAGPHSLNSMINHSKVTGFPLDNLHQMGGLLLNFRCAYPDILLTMWKSDISEAYRVCPMHPAWQLKQAVAIDGEYYIDRSNCFRSSAFFTIFISVNSLVAWIAGKKRNIAPLLTYIDDSSGFASFTFYEPYAKSFPTPQTRLLRLWDELGIPHKPSKQIFESTLPIIGIVIDPNELTFTLQDATKQRLQEEIADWTQKAGVKFRLRRWQQLAGWINWALNVCLMARPCLSNIYQKIMGKQDRSKSLWVNNTVKADLRWEERVFKAFQGTYLLKSVAWEPHEADTTIFCDACPSGLRYWFERRSVGFYSPAPMNLPTDTIFYLEALCVLSALTHAVITKDPYSKILIYTDSHNTVDIFNTLRAAPLYNAILQALLMPVRAAAASFVSCTSQEMTTKLPTPSHVTDLTTQPPCDPHCESNHSQPLCCLNALCNPRR